MITAFAATARLCSEVRPNTLRATGSVPQSGSVELCPSSSAATTISPSHSCWHDSPEIVSGGLVAGTTPQSPLHPSCRYRPCHPLTGSLISQCSSGAITPFTSQ